MLTYVALKDGGEIIAVCLEPLDLAALMAGHPCEISLSDLAEARAGDPEVEHLAKTTLAILGPGSTEQLLRAASEGRDAGIDVSIRDLRG
jgi:hypothetical protein